MFNSIHILLIEKFNIVLERSCTNIKKIINVAKIKIISFKLNNTPEGVKLSTIDNKIINNIKNKLFFTISLSIINNLFSEIKYNNEAGLDILPLIVQKLNLDI